MFGKDKQENANKPVEIPSRDVAKTEDKPVASSGKSSVISEGTKIKGEIFGTTDIEIYGEFEGTINLENNNINIETTAKIKADINAKTIRVNGNVVGNITANEKILVTNKGSVIGDITATKVELQDGANFDGNISMKKPNNTAKK